LGDIANLHSITAIGLGTWTFGGPDWPWGWGPQDDNVSIAAIKRAVAVGVNWIDTAPEYGLGHSEEIVGRAVGQIAPSLRPLIFTKCGITWGTDRFAETANDLRSATIEAECEASLRRLNVEVIDLYQIHWPDTQTGTPLEESWGTILELKQRGWIRGAGVCNFNVDQLETCWAMGGLTSVQPPLSLIKREALDDVIPWCKQHDVAVLVYSPLQSGLLTDAFSVDRARSLPGGDWRRKDPDFVPPGLTRNLATRDILRPIAKRHGVSVAAIAIAWCVAQPGVTGAITGARSESQVDLIVEAGSIQLDEGDLSEISESLLNLKA